MTNEQQIAMTLARYARRLGYRVQVSSSGMSRSVYVDCASRQGNVIIRISDHDLPQWRVDLFGSADYEIGERSESNADSWQDVVRALAARRGKPAPDFS